MFQKYSWYFKFSEFDCKIYFVFAKNWNKIVWKCNKEQRIEYNNLQIEISVQKKGWS